MTNVACLITHERPTEFAHTLQSLIFQTKPFDAIVILDNSSFKRSTVSRISDSLISWAANNSISVTVRNTTPMGMVKARIEAENLAYQLHPDACLYICDDDHAYTPHYVERVSAALSNYDIAGGSTISSISEESGTTYAELHKAYKSAGFFSGGTFAYRPCCKGLWGKVLEKTEGIAEDLLWQKLAQSRGFVFAPKEHWAGLNLHLDTYTPSKYGGEAIHRFIDSWGFGKDKPIR